MKHLAFASAVHETSTKSPFQAIGRMAENRLRMSGYLALRDVSCINRDGVIYLHGGLPSYYLKQLAQEIAARVEGVRLVVNKIEVMAPVRKRREA